METNREAHIKSGLYRIIGKFLIVFTKWTLVPGRYRAKIHSLRGVQFDDVNSVFFGENVTIDGIDPSQVSIGKRCIITAGTKILTHFIDTKTLSSNAWTFWSSA